jgi:hypothetical protein
MLGGSAKREMATSHGKAPSKEFGAKGREESPPRVKSHRSGNKKKNMKKVVYYETDESRLEGVDRRKLKFTNFKHTTSRG